MKQLAQLAHTNNTNGIIDEMIRGTDTNNQICGYDFTMPQIQMIDGVDGPSTIEKDKIITFLKLVAKKWCFQLERGVKDGYLHYQGRFSLKMKARKLTIAKQLHGQVGFAHLSETSNENFGNMFYVMKEDTRIEGPWCELDIKIPRHLQGTPEWYPYQNTLLKNAKEYEERIVNCLIDPVGASGKTTVMNWMAVRGMARKIPIQKDARDITRMVMDCPKTGCYFIDLPRMGNNERQMPSMYCAIEEIKNGYCYDDRHSFKEEWFDVPVIWVMCNQMPDKRWLSADRWKLWTINAKKELVPINNEEELAFITIERMPKPNIPVVLNVLK